MKNNLKGRGGPIPGGRVVLILVLLFFALTGHAQIVSEFTWDNSPATKAAVGPDATGISSYAASVAGGVGGTNGLTPNGHDINMTMAGSTFTGMQGIDVSVDFLRRENGASFFMLGNFDFGITTGAIYVKFTVNVGGAPTALTLGTGAATDALFHTYRFVYNNTTGVGSLYLDGVLKASTSVAANSPLVWGSGNATIGSAMDGSGSTAAELDNLIIQYPPILLPLELLSFDAVASGPVNKLSWVVANESGVREYVVERSVDNVSYSAIGSVAAGSVYAFTDMLPAAVNYYRLKFVDADGSFSYSPVKKVNGPSVSISCYPNPAVDVINVRVGESGGASFLLATSDGKVLQTGVIANGQASLNVHSAPHGMLVLRVANETFTVVKL